MQAIGRKPGEFRQHWRPLLGAILGIGSALSLNTYILSTFAPYLIGEFGWTRSQWAMMGMVQILVMICMPISGRLADLYGVRRTAAVGALAFPLCLVAIAMMNGDIRLYLAIYVVQTVLGSLTTSTVYSRVVAGAYSARRGLALGICGSGPPLIGAIGSPIMSAFVAEHGWRAGYLVIAAFCTVCAIVTLLLLEDDRPAPAPRRQAERKQGVYRAILTSPVFWLMLVATFLVNLPYSLATTQLKMVVLAQGLDDRSAALLISAFAIGSIAGRVLSGAALDTLPAPAVAAIAFGLPTLGLLMLASSQDSFLFVGVAIVLIGISFGGEGDIVPYLITRYFGITVYSTVLGLLTAAMGGAMAIGSGIIGVVLERTDSFNPYLFTAATSAFIGSVMFLMLGLPTFRKERLQAA